MIVAILHDMGRVRCIETREVEAGRLERPARGAIAAGHPAPHVLMEIDEDGEAVSACPPTDFGIVVQIAFVVPAWSGVLDGLPRREQPEAIEAPMREADEMRVDFVERRRPADEADDPMVREVGRQMAMAIGRERHLAVAAEIYAAQDDLAALIIPETGTFDRDGVPSHGRSPLRIRPASSGNDAAAHACGLHAWVYSTGGRPATRS
jgi:hypothetical protein